MYRRNISHALLEALRDTPAVLLQGVRQAGKSTLVREVAARQHPARYLTLDDLAVLAAASADPAGFIGGFEGPVIIDEVQRVPDLFLAIKASIDRDRRPGRFLLTGSANVLLLPKASEFLAGRMELLTLWPLSQGELEGREEHFVDALFSDQLEHRAYTTSRSDLLRRMAAGGFPEAVQRKPIRRRVWYDSYVTTILQRNIRDMANVEGLTALPRLLSLIAARCGSLLNVAEVSRTSGLPNSTLRRYLALFEAAFLVQTIPAWAAGLESRLVKSPRVYLSDSGLACHLNGVDEEKLSRDPNIAGPLFENFVAMELRKQCTWSRTRAQLFHYRLHTGHEVDLLLERDDGVVVGVEVKFAATVGAADLKGLKALREHAGNRFLRGILLYGGSESIALGSDLHALPVDALWAYPHQGEG